MGVFELAVSVAASAASAPPSPASPSRSPRSRRAPLSTWRSRRAAPSAFSLGQPAASSSSAVSASATGFTARAPRRGAARSPRARPRASPTSPSMRASSARLPASAAAVCALASRAAASDASLLRAFRVERGELRLDLLELLARRRASPWPGSLALDLGPELRLRERAVEQRLALRFELRDRDPRRTRAAPPRRATRRARLGSHQKSTVRSSWKRWRSSVVCGTARAGAICDAVSQSARLRRSQLALGLSWFATM